jgi:alkylation response protein AidB-like acyl-CoA dehydrogenase
VVLAENIARHSTAACQLFQHFGAVMVLRFAGTAEQQERLFPVVEERVSCLASTEAEAGSDLGAIRCHAADKGGSFVVNGEKCFITNGDVADVYTTLVTVQPGSGPAGIRLLLIDGRESPGVSVTARERKMGLRGSTIATLSFDDVEVPTGNMIGGERGFGALMAMFDFARPNVAAQGVGLATAAMEYALGYTLERRAFGRPVYEFQGVSFMIADMAIRIEAARELVYAAAAEVDRGGPRAGELAAMAKTFCTDTAMAVASDAVQCLGQHGYLADHPVERMMRDAKVLQIYEGTNQIQRLILSRLLAAELPRDGRKGATR